MKIEADIIVKHRNWYGVKEIKPYSIFVLNQLAKHLKNKKNLSVSILLTNGEEIQKLNYDFRGKNKPTNVLSFPSNNNDSFIGDIAIAYDVLRKECKEQNKKFINHYTHMLVHGTLHLLGYDHENEAEALKMESLETIFLKKLGIDNPYSD